MKFLQKFYPKKDFKNILEIKIDFLKQNSIKAIILDIDNTLIDYDNNIITGLDNWVSNLKNENIKFCILSNTNKKTKAEKLSKLLSIPYIYLAMKPVKKRFL